MPMQRLVKSALYDAKKGACMCKKIKMGVVKHVDERVRVSVFLLILCWNSLQRWI